MKGFKKLKLLPKVEVSFQDDFNIGTERAIILTTKYILSQLEKQKFQPKIGDKVLFWEKDEDEETGEDYLYNIGKIVEAKTELLKKYSGLEIPLSKLSTLGGTPVFIQVDNNLIFRSTGI